MRNQLRTAGLPGNLRTHSFRVLVVTDLLDQGVPLENVDRPRLSSPPITGRVRLAGEPGAEPRRDDQAARGRARRGDPGERLPYLLDLNYLYVRFLFIRRNRPVRFLFIRTGIFPFIRCNTPRITGICGQARVFRDWPRQRPRSGHQRADPELAARRPTGGVRERVEHPVDRASRRMPSRAARTP